MTDLRCSDCSEPVGMLRITRNRLRLGHLREPHPLHAVRLTRPAPENSVASAMVLSTQGRTGESDGSSVQGHRRNLVERTPDSLRSTRPPVLSAGEVEPSPLLGAPSSALSASGRSSARG